MAVTTETYAIFCHLDQCCDSIDLVESNFRLGEKLYWEWMYGNSICIWLAGKWLMYLENGNPVAAIFVLMAYMRVWISYTLSLESAEYTDNSASFMKFTNWLSAIYWYLTWLHWPPHLWDDGCTVSCTSYLVAAILRI